MERTGRSPHQIAINRRLLNEAAGRVLDAPGADKLDWSAEKDRRLADRVREEILDTLDPQAMAGRP
jgi:hypothetical protein